MSSSLPRWTEVATALAHPTEQSCTTVFVSQQWYTADPSRPMQHAASILPVLPVDQARVANWGTHQSRYVRFACGQGHWTSNACDLFGTVVFVVLYGPQSSPALQRGLASSHRARSVSEHFFTRLEPASRTGTGIQTMTTHWGHGHEVTFLTFTRAKIGPTSRCPTAARSRRPRCNETTDLLTEFNEYFPWTSPSHHVPYSELLGRDRANGPSRERMPICRWRDATASNLFQEIPAGHDRSQQRSWARGPFASSCFCKLTRCLPVRSAWLVWGRRHPAEPKHSAHPWDSMVVQDWRRYRARLPFCSMLSVLQSIRSLRHVAAPARSDITFSLRPDVYLLLSGRLECSCTTSLPCRPKLSFHMLPIASSPPLSHGLLHPSHLLVESNTFDFSSSSETRTVDGHVHVSASAWSLIV